MDDEAAEIELLEQHLNKSTQLSTRMTSILHKFDSRLVKLESTILPLHKSTQSLTRAVGNIDRTLEVIARFESEQDNVAAEEALIMRGPREDQLVQYIEAVQKLNVNIAFKGADRASKETARLAETGAKKLAQMFTKFIAESASTPPLANPMSYLPSPFSDIPLIDPGLVEVMRPLITSLRRLPVPATHPSHPAATSILATLQDAQKGYAEMRGSWVKRALDIDAHRLVEDAEVSEEGVVVGQEFGAWIETLILLAEAEAGLMQEILPLTSPPALQATFSTLTLPLVTLMSSTLSTLQSIIRKSTNSSHFLLTFSLFSSLADPNLQARYDNVLRAPKTSRKGNELVDATYSLRAICLRAFPELLAEIKMSGTISSDRTIEIGSGVAAITITTIDFLKRLPAVQDGVVAALRVLGDGNWNMGAATGNMRRVGEAQEVDDRGILEHFTYDVMSNLLTTLTTLTKTQRQLSLSSIFLLNNITHLRYHLLIAPTTGVDDFLSAKTQSLLNATFRSAKATYLESNFSVLVSSLSEDKAQSGLGSGRQSTKEKALRFFDCLEDVIERHRFVKGIMEDDDEGRTKMADDVVKLVVPVLALFLAKHREKEFSKNPTKYIKAPPDEVERQLRACYGP